MKTTLKFLAAGLALTSVGTQAAGPLFLWEGGENPTPYKWDTSNGPIPVYTDGGDAFTYDFDGVTPFITIERANEITQFAFDQWNNVETSTFEANVVGTIESVTGIADVTGANATAIYGVENGYGFFVNYDSTGDILEDYFGVPRTNVLGIAFPEWADEETGEIVEATAVINGYYVFSHDTEGKLIAGVFTHEFGHAINLSHAQVNGHMAYNSYPGRDIYPGVPGCGVEPYHVWRYNFSGFNPVDIYTVETMYPAVDHRREIAEAVSYISTQDDKVAISNLYPTDAYLSETGTISGVLRLKDGATEYSGINIVARNVNDLMGDATSVLAGDQTAGLAGPDGRFTIRGLTPGESYVLYMEEIAGGGYPTTPRPLVSAAEYWNEAESNDPIADTACDATPIVAQAGVTASADLTFNGYLDGIQYTPLVGAHLSDLSKNGKKSAGLAAGTVFRWNEDKLLDVLPPAFTGSHGPLNRTGQRMGVQYDVGDNGILEAAIFDFTGMAGKGEVIPLGDFNGDTCGGSSQRGVNSSVIFDLDDSGNKAVGLAYIDTDGDGYCQRSNKNEIIPWVWTRKAGMEPLSLEGKPFDNTWYRAQRLSGDGNVILGNTNGRAIGWLDGELIDLFGMFQARDPYAINKDGSVVPLGTYSDGVVIWNALTGGHEYIGGLEWCTDMPYIEWGFNYCDVMSGEDIAAFVGPPPLLPLDTNDNGTVITGRAGSPWTGTAGAIWIDSIGWMSTKTFFEKQGVPEALILPMDNPGAIDGKGNTLVGGVAGLGFAWHVDLQEVFVCKKGKSVSTNFPEGVINAVRQGAEFGRCEHLD